MKLFRIIVVAVLLAVLAGCGVPEPTYLGVIADGGTEPSGWTPPPPPPPPPAVTPTPARTAASSKPTKIRVVLDISVLMNADGTVSVGAESNLPDGTTLGGMVFEEGGFMAQSSQLLDGGTANFGPFSNDGGPVPAGTYAVSVTMPLARLQPAEVRALIGETGEYLTGPQVKQKYGNATVTVEKRLVIK